MLALLQSAGLGPIATMDEHDEFNDVAANLRGEGVTFIGVRQLHLLDMPPQWNDFVQRVGRASRHDSHANLPAPEKTLSVYLHTATAGGLPVDAVDRQLFSTLLKR